MSITASIRFQIIFFLILAVSDATILEEEGRSRQRPHDFQAVHPSSYTNKYNYPHHSHMERNDVPSPFRSSRQKGNRFPSSIPSFEKALKSRRKSFRTICRVGNYQVLDIKVSVHSRRNVDVRSELDGHLRREVPIYELMTSIISRFPSELVVDLGANHGLYSLAAAHKGARRVIAVEPNNLLVPCLRVSIQENGFEKKITFFHNAILDDEVCSIAFFFYSNQSAPNSLFPSDPSRPRHPTFATAAPISHMAWH